MTVEAGTLRGPAGVFDATDRGKLSSPLFAAVANCSIEFWIRPIATGRIFRIGPAATGPNPALDIRIEPSTGAWEITKRTTAGSTISAASGAVALGQEYHVVVVIGDGVHTALYVNGEPVTLTHGGPARAGNLALVATDELAIGDPTPTDRTGFAGGLGRVFFWSFALSAKWVKASYRLQSDQIAWTGISAENAAAAPNRGPVAMPIHGVTTPAGQAVDIDVVTRAFDPESELLTAFVPSPPTQGVSTIVSNRVRYTPQGGSASPVPHTVPTGVRDPGLRASISIARVLVTAPTIGPEFPSPIGFQTRIATNVTEFDAAYAASNPGDHVLVRGSFSIPARNFTRPGSQANPIVIRAENNQQVQFTGTLTASASNLYFWGFRGVQFSFGSGVPQRITMRRMNFGGNASGFIAETAATDCVFEYCTFNNSPSGGIRLENASRRITFRFCHWYDIRNGASSSESLLLLEGVQQTFTNGGFLVEDCLFEDCNRQSGDNETIAVKCSGVILRRVQFINCKNMSLRFGNGNQVLGCRGEDISNSVLNVRGRDHIINNYLGPIIMSTGNVNAARTTFVDVPGSEFDNALNCRVIGGGVEPGQTGALSRIQLGDDNNRTFKAIGTIVEGRGLTPNITQLNNGGNGATIIPSTSVPLVDRPNFAPGQLTNHPLVGVRGEVA